MHPADGESEEDQQNEQSATVTSGGTGNLAASSSPNGIDTTTGTTASSLVGTPILASRAQTPSSPPTPITSTVPRIAETPPLADTPGSLGSVHDGGSPFLTSYNLGSTRDVHNTPRCSIPGGEKGSLELIIFFKYSTEFVCI